MFLIKNPLIHFNTDKLELRTLPYFTYAFSSVFHLSQEITLQEREKS